MTIIVIPQENERTDIVTATQYITKTRQHQDNTNTKTGQKTRIKIKNKTMTDKDLNDVLLVKVFQITRKEIVSKRQDNVPLKTKTMYVKSQDIEK